MSAAGILRVGIFTLIISMTLRAETIPFDYWYGRIVGADRAALEYLDGRSDLATYCLSFGIGSRGKYELYSPDRYIYIPNSSSDKLNSTNAGLNWIQKTPFHSRYEFTLLSLLNEKYDYVSSGYNGVNDVDEFSFSHRFQIWSGVSLEFDPTTAAYVLVNGPWYSARDFHVVIDNLILRNDNNRDFNIIRVQPSATFADTGKYDAADQQTDISGSATIGLGRGYLVNITVHTNKQMRSSTTRRRYQWIYDEGAFIDTTYSHLAFRDRAIDRAGGVEIAHLLRSTMWASLSYQYSHEAHRNERFEHRECTGSCGSRYDDRLDLTYGSDYAHEVVGRFTWLSRNQVIERQKLLDNFRGYYGNELERGTVLMQTELGWYRERFNLQDTRYEGTENEVVEDELDVQRTHELSVNTKLSYYLRPNVTTGANLQIERSVLERAKYYDPDFHNTQSTTLSYWFEYRSYRWQADKRREISWDQVSDIDYLLGPMLRKADLRVRIEATAPALESASNSNSGQLWNLQFGSLNRDWEVTLAGALGLLHNCEIGSTFNYRFHRYNWYPKVWITRYTDENWETTLKWQPVKMARLSCSFKYTYERAADDDYYPEGPREGSTWGVSTKVDVVW